MPVYKFKSLEEAACALWNFDPDAEYYRRIARLFELGFRLSPPACRRGVSAFRSIEEANALDKYHKPK